MQRGNLVIYDQEGKIFFQSGEAVGDELPVHQYPNGIPYLVIPFGTMAKKRLVSIDVSKTPHEPIFEDIPYVPTYEDLQNEILIAKGVI